MDVNEIAANCLDQLDLGENEFMRVYRMCMRGIRVMEWDFIGVINTVQINVLANKTAPLPDNFMKLKKIGIINNGTGEIATFIENPNLNMLDVECDDRTTENSGYGYNPDLDTTYDYNDYNDLNINNDRYRRERYFARFGSNTNLGEYRIDKSRNIVVFSPEFKPTTFILEYLASTDKKGRCDVPDQVSEALIGWVLWQYKKDKKTYSAQEKRDSSRYFYNENRKARLRIMSLTKSRKNQSSRQGVRQNKR